LPEDERSLFDHARLLHLEPEVVALSRALAHAGEDREALVLLRDVADELLDEHGLADSGTAEEADLAALHVGSEQVDDLDPGLEDLSRRLQLFEARRVAVNRPALVGLDVVPLVDDVAENVEDPAEGRIADRNADRRARVLDVHAAGEPVGGVHGHRTDAVVAEVLLDLGDQVEGGSPLLLRHRNADRVVDGRKPSVKDGVDDDSLDLDDLARVVVSHESPGRLPGSVYPSASGRDPATELPRRSLREAGRERVRAQATPAVSADEGAGAGGSGRCGSSAVGLRSVQERATSSGARSPRTRRGRLPPQPRRSPLACRPEAGCQDARSGGRRSRAARAARRALPPWSPPAGPRTRCSSSTRPGAARAPHLRARSAR